MNSVIYLQSEIRMLLNIQHDPANKLQATSLERFSFTGADIFQPKEPEQQAAPKWEPNIQTV